MDTAPGGTGDKSCNPTLRRAKTAMPLMIALNQIS